MINLERNHRQPNESKPQLIRHSMASRDLWHVLPNTPEWNASVESNARCDNDHNVRDRNY
jgi:hypothetical protein